MSPKPLKLYKTKVQYNLNDWGLLITCKSSLIKRKKKENHKNTLKLQVKFKTKSS